MKLMNFRFLEIIFLACTITACALPLPISQQAVTPLPKPDWQGMVDRFLAVKPDFHQPENLQKIPAVRQETDFDISQYFTVLDHLSMEKGYNLDYAYYLDGFSGMPVLYARPLSTPFYKTYDEYIKANPGTKINGYLAHVRSDGTPEGFFQYTILAIMGNQFYQWWHAQTNDQVIIPGREALEKILTDGMASKYGAQLSTETATKARTLNLKPQVDFVSSTMVIKVVTFTKWGGFKWVTYTLQKDFPHTDLSNPHIETLVEYNCGTIP